jgi:hypothetical protein
LDGGAIIAAGTYKNFVVTAGVDILESSRTFAAIVVADWLEESSL